jgi:hypothetical protein
MSRKSPSRLPKSLRAGQEKRTIILQVSFASVTGTESDEDAQRFLAKLEKLMDEFTAKSEFKYKLTKKNETRRSTTP